MTPDPQFKKPDERTLLISMVLQDIKDVLLQQKSTDIVTIQAEKTNSYFWAQYDPRDEEMWFDEFYGDTREAPFFSIGIASDKEEILTLLQDKGVIKNFVVNSVKEDPINWGRLIEFVRSFRIELNVVKFLKYYDTYTKAAKPALDQYLALNGNSLPEQKQKVENEEDAQKKAFSAKLSLNEATKTIRLTTLGKTIDIKNFSSKRSDNYRAFKQLILHPDQALSRKEMDLSLRGSVVKDMPKTMGFNAKLKNIFFTTDSKKETLALHPEKILPPEDAEIIRQLVNSNSTKNRELY